MSKYLTTLKLLPLLGIIIFLAWYLASAQVKQAPTITMQDLDGQKHVMTQQTGHPTLMIFWATDCPGCIKEIPDLNQLYHDYHPRGLTMLGVAMSHDNPRHIRAMQQEKALPYPLIWDKNNEIARAFNSVRVTPTHFLIDQQGNIVMRKIGELNFVKLRAKLDKLMAKHNSL